MKHELLVLDEDKKWARNRIAEIEAEIMALGPEFYDAFNQTSETYHDNAPFEIVRDRQTLLAAERHKLKQILNNCAIKVPKPKKGTVGIGSRVTAADPKTGKETTYFIAGDWTPHAGQIIDGALVVSRKSPIGIKLIRQDKELA